MTTLLVVEDDISLNKGIALTLARDGVTIRQAYDLATADKLFSNGSIDLIILDVNLPDGSGLDFCERDTPAIPGSDRISDGKRSGGGHCDRVGAGRG